MSCKCYGLLADQPPQVCHCSPVSLRCRLIDQLNYEYGIRDVIVFNEGRGGLPRVWVKHPHRCGSGYPAMCIVLGPSTGLMVKMDACNASDCSPAGLPPQLPYLHIESFQLPLVRSAMGFELYLHGAAITQWLRPDGKPSLDYHPEANSFDGGHPIK